MNESRYGQYFVTELKQGVRLPSFRHGEIPGEPTLGQVRREHVLWVDSEIVPGCFYSEYAWLFPEQKGAAEVHAASGPGPHTHPFDEVVSFVGTNQDDLTDLGGEIELWLEDHQFVLTRSFLVYIPAGMRHRPLKIRRIERPIFQYVLGSGLTYEDQEAPSRTAGAVADLSRHFVFDYKKDLVHPEYRGRAHDEPGVHMHIAYLDAEVVPNANFYVEASWFGTAPRPKPVPGREPTGPQPHSHPFPELITFFGTNPDDVHDLGGEAELWIDGEQHILTQSFVAYVPGGVVHCPLMLRNVKRPIFHFTAGPGKMYV
jgi:mannose-6-phosphate isomerase-like protein (cupin superfamily)